VSLKSKYEQILENRKTDMTEYLLTPYDEFPVHQAPHPFSYIPSTDYSWDDGYYFGVFNPDAGVFLATGMRINPNSDMVGGYALLNVRGRQYTVRFSRCWRPNFQMEIGPYRIEVLEPMRKLRLVMEENDSGLTFDVIWEGASPAYLEKHHVASRRGRRTTDQTRYSQPGRCAGYIALDGQRWEVTPDSWGGSRDHSWGLYAERPPFGPDALWLPPAPKQEARRALRIWTCFTTGDYSGFFHLHEDENGNQLDMNDVFGNAFEGHVYKGWDDSPIHLKTAEHTLRFVEGKRPLQSAEITLTDEHGGVWLQKFDTGLPPWLVQTMGYTPGSWKDGGTFFTWHGSEELALEWEDSDYADQPVHYRAHGAGDNSSSDGFGIYDSYQEPIYGLEYNARVTTLDPDGNEHQGSAQFEFFLTPPYRPAGFE
jgi:hypothetical protein